MVVIRMARGGMKKAPFYRVVAADKREPRDGRFIEKLGFFNPVASGQAERLNLDLARVDYWVGQGAQLSDRVRSLVKELRRSSAA
jgi:small subunit ribosomal protein S16